VFLVLWILKFNDYNSCKSTTNSILCSSVSCYFDNSQCCGSYQSNCLINNWLTAKDPNTNVLLYTTFGTVGVPPSVDGSTFNMCVLDKDIELFTTVCSKNNYEFCNAPRCSSVTIENKQFCGFGNTEQLPVSQPVSLNLCFYANDPEILKSQNINLISENCVAENVKGLYGFAWKRQSSLYSYNNLFKD